jgi:broad specificity phosphatase PhoE
MWRFAHAFVAVALSAAAPIHASDPAWAALKSGNHVLIMRHVQTVPGIGDPPEFKLNDCKTQRNINDLGREQAARWKAEFAARNIAVGGVYSSQWCRCVDTAKLAFGKVDTWPALNSHFDTPQTADRQADQVRGGIAVRMQKGKNLVLVTHQVNVSALTGISPATGEAVVAAFVGGQLKVVGTIRP